jgi:hypothetical protein
MRILADFLKNDVDASKIAEAIEPLDNSISALPDSYGIKEKIEQMLEQTIVLSKQNGDSSYKVFSMCASIIAGASTVVSCFIEADDSDT